MSSVNVVVVDASNYSEHSELISQMHRDRTQQFVDELGWELSVDEEGGERDEYDVRSATYLILTDQDDNHLGSTRLLPTIEPNMTAHLFADVVGGEYQDKQEIWESTRFFVSKRSSNRGRDAIRLMKVGVAFAQARGVISYIGVSAKQMIPLFAACGWKPRVLGTSVFKGLEICGCLWRLEDFRHNQRLIGQR